MDDRYIEIEPYEEIVDRDEVFSTVMNLIFHYYTVFHYCSIMVYLLSVR